MVSTSSFLARSRTLTKLTMVKTRGGSQGHRDYRARATRRRSGWQMHPGSSSSFSGNNLFIFVS